MRDPLHLGEYRLTTDAYNVRLERQVERKRKDSGELYWDWEIQGFFPTVAMAVKRIPELAVLSPEIDNLAAVVNRLTELADNLDTLLNWRLGEHE
ncbi:MAG: hypothetical protein AAF628_08435 [Planctomycetota bacterium]